MDVTSDDEGNLVADESLDAAFIAPAQSAPGAATNGIPIGVGGMSDGHILQLKPILAMPAMPHDADSDVRALHEEFLAEDADPQRAHAEVSELLALPPAGLARRIRDLENAHATLQMEEVDVLLELGIEPGTTQSKPS